MKTFDFDQRVEEIQLAMVDVFDSPKRPAISLVDEGETVFLQISWVVESHRDTTLDARCAATLRFTRAQLDRYAALDTARRVEVQQRLRQRVRERFEAERPPAHDGECAFELAISDTEFDTRPAFQ
ncbi:DUF3022 domain-containing protein [Paraburkholderia acidisoli]|uniref:DUF3022 domain-containing protein n=1 Tax=Paraburkholderia acidisoli TaxID=2571748 RepID=A0A7Z2GNF0_9BURK|nr:DUF3022 domain-containing protein [Paraburkholderia acidisoli]QGZ64933.1 DUF3022 domain-containing protein [Paraburkholderia acidisoli]